ncbi:actin-binding WH2 domain-containing protein [candidate division KSB1 bacterium]|nr:actin-binding WH2 domain-containing protein [candidate division KSB1 bacterium]
MKDKLFSMEFLSALQEKDELFDKLSQKDFALKKIISFYLLLVIFLFIYGIVMGSYNGFLQAISSGFKVPVMFTLEIIICFPAFFIIQLILGSKLGFYQMLAIILTGFVLSATIMVSFAPIVLFFLITASNYEFLKLLHVGIFILSGIFGMKAIIDALKFSCEKKNIYPKVGVQVFRFWIIILAFVGMQLAWNLRPFVGSKNMPFELFRERGGNFYTAVIQPTFELISPRPVRKFKTEKTIKTENQQTKVQVDSLEKQ